VKIVEEIKTKLLQNQALEYLMSLIPYGLAVVDCHSVKHSNPAFSKCLNLDRNLNFHAALGNLKLCKGDETLKDEIQIMLND